MNIFDSPDIARLLPDEERKARRSVAIWVYTGVIMLLIQVVLGGITRLTGSGLSITEWNVVTGTLPPLSESKWMEAFDKYKETPQYHILNSDFQLSNFKFIFFWEWFHRFWARMVGVVFVVGFAWLMIKGRMRKAMIRPLLILFLMGALQGAIGWIMVASGLTGDAIYVRPTRLALHFVFALALVIYAFWFALQLSVDRRRFWTGEIPSDPQLPESGPSSVSGRSSAPGLSPAPGLSSAPGLSPASGLSSASGPSSVSGLSSTPGRSSASAPATLRRVRTWTIAILVTLFLQLAYGALMAGHKAATVAPTWPSINGQWIPAGLFSGHPLSADLIGNTITVQFVHRGLAYLILILVLIWTFQARQLNNPGGSWRRLSWLPLAVVACQILLGILSLLTSPHIVPNRWVIFDWMAQMHQIVGLLFLLTITGMLYLVRKHQTA